MNIYLKALTELANECQYMKDFIEYSGDDTTEQQLVDNCGVGTSWVAMRMVPHRTTGHVRNKLNNLVKSGHVIKSKHTPGAMNLWLPVGYLQTLRDGERR